MRLVLITPLYPPDIGSLGVFMKELATHLKQEHEVIVVTYGRLPESIPGVEVLSVSKQKPLLVRLALFTIQIYQATRHADGLLVGDGAAVGIPALLASKIRTIPLIRLVRHDEAWERNKKEDELTQTEREFISTNILTYKNRLIRWLQARVLQGAKQLFVPTQDLKDLFVHIDQIPSERISLLPYPPEKARILPPGIIPLTEATTVSFQATRSSGSATVWDIYLEHLLSPLKKQGPV